MCMCGQYINICVCWCGLCMCICITLWVYLWKITFASSLGWKQWKLKKSWDNAGDLANTVWLISHFHLCLSAMLHSMEKWYGFNFSSMQAWSNNTSVLSCDAIIISHSWHINISLPYHQYITEIMFLLISTTINRASTPVKTHRTSYQTTCKSASCDHFFQLHLTTKYSCLCIWSVISK